MAKEKKRSARVLRALQASAESADAAFRAKVREEAEAGTFSRRELAELLGLSTTTIQRIVSGKP